MGALSGCAPEAQQSDKRQLNTAFTDLESRRYDQAFDEAGAFLKKSPAGPGSAEALYVQGRVYEARAESAGAARNPQEARTQLTAAANAYLSALQRKPPKETEGLSHAGLANAAFHLDDYPTALREWELAFPLIARREAKAWVLYRIGLCRQRLGQFEQADRAFSQLTQEFRDQDAAPYADAMMGQRAFYVQVGIYTSIPLADRDLAQVQATRLPGNRSTDPASGRQVVRAGPFVKYFDAKAAQSRLLGKFPDSAIFP